MAIVKIGHARHGESGYGVHGGRAGDQDGSEVAVTNWYNNGWTVLLRPTDIVTAERMAVFCETCCNGNFVGYDQWQRNTLRDVARSVGWDASKIKTNCETDCSAFMTVCAEAAGINMDGTYLPLGNGQMNAPVCSTMRKKFTATGRFLAYTDRKYLTGTDYLRRGDILVNETKHTIMVLTNGTKEEDNMLSAKDLAAIIRNDKSGVVVAAICDRIDADTAATIVRKYRQKLQAAEGSDWSKGDRSWASKEAGLFHGDENGKYMWLDLLSREQAASLFHRFEERILGMMKK